MWAFKSIRTNIYHFLFILICFISLLPQSNSILNCESNADCKKHSFCHLTKKCKCEKGFTETITYDCVPTKNIGDPCNQDLECWYTLTELSVCRDGKCDCGDDTNRVDEKCYFKSKVDEICFSDENCVAEKGVSSKCDDTGLCKCSNNQKPLEDKSGCLNIKHLVDSCSIGNDECVDENSVCNTVCDCKTGYIISRNETVCLKKAQKLGDPCTEDAQCSESVTNSICENKKCACIHNCKEITQDSGPVVPPEEATAKTPVGNVTEQPKCKENDATSLNHQIIYFLAMLHIVYLLLH